MQLLRTSCSLSSWGSAFIPSSANSGGLDLSSCPLTNLHLNHMGLRWHWNNMFSYFSVRLPAFRGDKGKCRHGAESRGVQSEASHFSRPGARGRMTKRPPCSGLPSPGERVALLPSGLLMLGMVEGADSVCVCLCVLDGGYRICFMLVFGLSKYEHNLLLLYYYLFTCVLLHVLSSSH